VGNGLAEVAFLAALTVVVLPCCFFTLLALLDRFERSLDPDAQTPPTLVMKPAPVAVVAAVEFDDETRGADIVSLPIAVSLAEGPTAATG
jgi:hypothetical protein